MIRTSRHLKALVRNLSKGDSTKAQIIIRNYEYASDISWDYVMQMVRKLCSEVK